MSDLRLCVCAVRQYRNNRDGSRDIRTTGKTTCRKCRGAGMVRTCRDCDGAGMIPGSLKCPICDGSGTIGVRQNWVKE
jgi:DnaJ-class molecular chaperone